MHSIEQLRQIFSYDPETGVFRWKRKGGKGRRPNGLAGSHTPKSPYCAIYLEGKRYLAHRLAYAITVGSWPEHEIDHIDGNGMNNSWTNLRPAKKSENAWNACVRRSNTSGFKGVSFHKGKNLWRAYIRVHGKQITLGYFPTPEEAGNAYAAGAALYHGEFANPGHPIRPDQKDWDRGMTHQSSPICDDTASPFL